MEDFKYLRSVISSNGYLDKVINVSVCKARHTLGCLWSCVLNQNNILQLNKLKVYKAIILTSLLYGCETWILYRRHLKLLEHFHMHSLRSILGMLWQDKITNLEILNRAETTGIKAMILKVQLLWTGHVIWMEDSRMPKQLLYGELSLGKRNQGRPQKQFKDCMKAHITVAGIIPKQLEQCVQDHISWCTLNKTGAWQFWGETAKKPYQC